jgi:predicted membrane protein
VEKYYQKCKKCGQVRPCLIYVTTKEEYQKTTSSQRKLCYACYIKIFRKKMKPIFRNSFLKALICVLFWAIFFMAPININPKICVLALFSALFLFVRIKKIPKKRGENKK